jgi:hydroxymethylpyrimidine/phosphomethylpyrimidine kinase
MTPIALTIAGSDPSGGAGLQADLKVFHQLGVYGSSVVTLVTVQNTLGVSEVEVLSADLVKKQLLAVITDLQPVAAKIGALGNIDIIEMLAKEIPSFSFPLVIDPVMVSKHGAPLLEHASVETLAKKLLPHTYLVTPNILEAKVLTGLDVYDALSMKNAALAIQKLGAKNVLIKGGHLESDAIDLLLYGNDIITLTEKRIKSNNTHGTGCVLSSAITARLCLGDTLVEAVGFAKKFITKAIETAEPIGHGVGPVNLQICP